MKRSFLVIAMLSLALSGYYNTASAGNNNHYFSVYSNQDDGDQNAKKEPGQEPGPGPGQGQGQNKEPGQGQGDGQGQGQGQGQEQNKEPGQGQGDGQGQGQGDKDQCHGKGHQGKGHCQGKEDGQGQGQGQEDKDQCHGKGHQGKGHCQGKEDGQGQGGQGQDKVPGDYGQGKEPGQHDDGQDEPGQGQGLHDVYRADCRFFNKTDTSGARFCYASILYKKYGKDNGDVKLGIGCDYQTLFSGPAEFHAEQVGDRVSPTNAAFPAVELPTDALRSPGTYQAILDFYAGRIVGSCYVKQMKYADLLSLHGLMLEK